MHIYKAFVPCVLSLCVSLCSAQPSVVQVVQTDTGWQMVRNGEPYFVNGAGGWSELKALKASGGNSIRTWSMDNAERILDQAHEHGLTATIGIWVPHPRHGFDWTDAQARKREMQRIRDRVAQLKDHPALLAWGIGNEVEHEAEDRLDMVLGVIEEAAAVVKSVDPNHPRIAVVAGAGHDKVARLAASCPSIDIVGVNSYGGAGDVPEALSKQGYDRPYMITEFGPRGWWESPSTPWNAPVEPSSEEKAEQYVKAYERGITREIGKRCLGSYVFLWGWKQEATTTWFGMFLETGEPTPTTDAMTRAWTGAWPKDRAPTVRGMRGLKAGDVVRPGASLRVRAMATDPEGKTLTPRWVVVKESTDRKTGGDAEASPATVDSDVNIAGLSATIEAPTEPGPYRLFLYVTDSSGTVGTANVPFMVASDE